MKFWTELDKTKLFCKVRVHNDFHRFVNYWENGLKVGQFVWEGGHSLFNTLYLPHYALSAHLVEYKDFLTQVRFKDLTLMVSNFVE